ncbi:MAG: nitroreductase family protein [Clostridia bacterium]|nr:nitroreductase family protein [Clostridia bacterium]
MNSDLKDLVCRTRSYRAYDPAPVTEETLRELVDVARLTNNGMNMQELKYRLVTGDEAAGLHTEVRWAGLLSVKLPPEGSCPPAYILICLDTAVRSEAASEKIDVGIAAEAIALAATERGLGSCMLGSFDRGHLAGTLHLPEGLIPELLLSIGKPAETVVLTDLPADGKTAYYRDAAGTHFVPKRPLDDVIVR